QLEVLAEMGELLQTARNVDEFYVVADRYVRRLFPERRGFLAILETARDRAKVAVAWGAGDIGLGEPGRLPADDCWAMRQGRPHICQPRPDALFCPHSDSEVPLATACVPLSAQGDLVGVFHVASRLAEDLRDVWPLVRMAKATAKSIELSLNNLSLRERLREQAFRDPLTDLYNRRYMEDALQREIHRARRSRGPVSMLVVDVDHFKRLNDSRGHDAGDEVLRRLGEILASAVRDSDIACRFGGEEFALVLPDCAARVAARKAERIRGRIEEMVVAYGDDRISGVTVSIGVATTGGDDGWSGRDLFRAADRALYAAKRAGRNQVIVYRQRAEPLSSVPPGSDAVPTEPPTRVVEGLPPAPVRIRGG
ncbi:MAG TPA: sensor domain-containing diguanylate cyclase, partial [Polyangiaceae bacterium LLY-WYZ-14_1]|nr:sensor domain-containing diguanylate cyclase [Polyangiaceae bacterium LLY-WYZ-14_1]